MSIPRHKMAAEPPETLFTTKKKFGGGSSKNKTKGFSGGASAGLPGQALGLSLYDSASIALKIGLSKLVKASQVKLNVDSRPFG